MLETLSQVFVVLGSQETSGNAWRGFRIWVLRSLVISMCMTRTKLPNP